ncbi:MAG: NAD-dependent epimerase/dehydratase family protein [Magnetococcales bacterium]|nr:NAD-dependent epimerase/dehydratase family protein [Magnetococcales bacterium]NGZ05893.1 NAD-dependent epimerase/dehydratase family protein [Magnetococcales bacterium]
MATWLITGGCGFIGSHLADALEARGDRVRILDDLSSGRRENVSATCEVVVGDVAAPGEVARLMEGVDGCWHLAAISSVARSNEAWVATHQVNQTGTIRVFEAARHAGAGQMPVPVVYASSAAVYGNNSGIPLSEHVTPFPFSAYGADKLGSEHHARVAALVHGVATTGLRFFNVHGPRQDPASPYSGVISIFARQILARQPVCIHGDGEQTRDFVFVADVVRFLLQAMVQTRGAAAYCYNVCTGQAISIRALAHLIGRLCGHEPVILSGPGRLGDIRHALGAPDLAAERLGMRAVWPMERALRLTLQGLTDSTLNLARMQP